MFLLRFQLIILLKPVVTNILNNLRICNMKAVACNDKLKKIIH